MLKNNIQTQAHSCVRTHTVTSCTQRMHTITNALKQYACTWSHLHVLCDAFCSVVYWWVLWFCVEVCCVKGVFLLESLSPLPWLVILITKYCVLSLSRLAPSLWLAWGASADPYTTRPSLGTLASARWHQSGALCSFWAGRQWPFELLPLTFQSLSHSQSLGSLASNFLSKI